MAKANINPNLVIDGVMLTMYDQRNRLSAQVGKPVIIYDPECAGSKAYINLADEMLSRHARARRK